MGVRLLLAVTAFLAAGTAAHPHPTQTPWVETRTIEHNSPVSPIPYNPGGPKPPIKTHPHITKVTPVSPTGPSPPGSEPSDGACTSTMQITYSMLPTPPYWPQCSFDGTERIYAATSTLYRQVDCKGCTDVIVKANPEVHCPAMIIKATTKVATATTKYVTVCSPTAAARQVLERQAAMCSTTMYVSAGQDGGPASTVYRQIVQQVQKVQCGGCTLVVSTRVGGLGPIYRPSSTVTGAVATSTTYLCQ